MKLSLFDYLFLVVYASASALANDPSSASTSESSPNSPEQDAKMLICILLQLMSRMKQNFILG